MKNVKPLFFGFILTTAVTLVACGTNHASGDNPWTAKQLMEPSELNKILSDAKAEKPVVFNIGFGGGIPGSVDVGAAKDKVNIEKFKAELSKLPKDKAIVIYCGCCPFDPCPNIRPAFSLLNEMGFTSHKLLNLKQNFKVDWIDKGFPITN